MLDTVSSASPSITYSLDSLGNLKTDRTYNKQNQITNISTFGVSMPTYDGNGNTTGDDKSRTMTYDAWNHMVSAVLPITGGTTSATYSYDALGRRIHEDTETSIEDGPSAVGAKSPTITYPESGSDFYYTTNWQVIVETSDGSPKYDYVWSAGAGAAGYVNGLMSRVDVSDPESPVRVFAQHDANFDITSLSDGSSSTVLERMIYDPYGAATYKTAIYGSRSTSSYSWIYLFQDGRFDGVSGTYVFQHRDLSTSLQRWTENDVWYLGGPNLYQLDGSNPERYVDPQELVFTDPDGNLVGAPHILRAMTTSGAYCLGGAPGVSGQESTALPEFGA